jgi:hypothetical protein
MSTKNIKIIFLGSKVRPVRRADNLTTICEPIVDNVGSLTPQPYRPQRPVTGIALLFFYFTVWSYSCVVDYVRLDTSGYEPAVNLGVEGNKYVIPPLMYQNLLPQTMLNKSPTCSAGLTRKTLPKEAATQRLFNVWDVLFQQNSGPAQHPYMWTRWPMCITPIRLCVTENGTMTSDRVSERGNESVMWS